MERDICGLKKFTDSFCFVMLVISISLLSACGGGGKSAVDTSSGGTTSVIETGADLSSDVSYSGSDWNAVMVAKTGTFDYTYTCSSAAKDVYFVFSNISTSASSSAPTVSSSEEQVTSFSRSADTETIQSAAGTETVTAETAFSVPDAVREFNANPPELLNETGLSRSVFTGTPVLSADTVGNTKTGTNAFYVNGSSSSRCNATCRKVVSSTISGTTHYLNIWVADASWGTGTDQITQSMVDALAAKFLTDTTNIYSVVTNIYGAEWGTPSYSNLIASDNNITILIYGINGDSMPSGSVTVGYFFGGDNYKNSGSSSVSYSNQRIMFYINAPVFAHIDTSKGDTAGTWVISIYYSSIVISTLTHEFQHMIHFYKKYVLLGTSSDTWLNEMCSMVTEDLVADKIASGTGPRGVAYGTAGAGSASNTNGRLPYFNSYYTRSLFDWSDVYSYSVAYAYGAYLARNYGGAALFQKIVQNSYGDYRAITSAIAANGLSTDLFTHSFRKWGMTALLSNKTDTVSPVMYNHGSSFMTSTVNSVTYNLGSINLYNYSPTFSVPTTMPTASILPMSNVYYKAASLLAAGSSKTWHIAMPADVRLSVVSKAP